MKLYIVVARNRENNYTLFLPRLQPRQERPMTREIRGNSLVKRSRPWQSPDPPIVQSALCPMNGFHRQRWIVFNDAQECGCRSRRASPILFPVLQGLHADTD